MYEWVCVLFSAVTPPPPFFLYSNLSIIIVKATVVKHSLSTWNLINLRLCFYFLFVASSVSLPVALRVGEDFFSPLTTSLVTPRQFVFDHPRFTSPALPSNAQICIFSAGCLQCSTSSFLINIFTLPQASMFALWAFSLCVTLIDQRVDTNELYLLV